MSKRNSKPIGPATICNICGLPDMDHPEIREEQTIDKKTGETKTTTYEVCCLDHAGVHPSMWNLHPKYDRFKKFLVRQRKQAE